MANETLPKQFIFNEKMDKEWLFSLYADDYVYMEEIFATTLLHFDPDFDSVQLAYEAGNSADLKKAIHKIKPTFGFIGLLDLQLQCKNFEDLCMKVSAISDLAPEYKQIRSLLLEAKPIIESEHKRLKEFNANPL
jgi:hypothetical protein